MRDVRAVVWSIAAGLAGVVLCGAGSRAHGADAAPSPPGSPIIVAAAQVGSSSYDQTPVAPPVLMAQTIVPATPVVAIQQPAAPAVVAQGSIVRVVTPNGSQPGALWLLAIGAALYWIGARVVRV